ncbi:hypothetical protein BDQ17DRAFT_1334959 [Cyathus striatus]|nr:hypothetical protein BDQ17DRAFT_1334959 [Cyathus striatus]
MAIGGSKPNHDKCGSSDFDVERQADKHKSDYLTTLEYSKSPDDLTDIISNEDSVRCSSSAYNENNYQKKSMHHSRLIEYLMKWILDVNHLNLSIELYFHIFKHLLTKSAVPFKDLGKNIKASRRTFMNAIEKFGLQTPRMEKLEMYMNEFLVRCDSDECLQGYDNYIESDDEPSDNYLLGTSQPQIHNEPDATEGRASILTESTARENITERKPKVLQW